MWWWGGGSWWPVMLPFMVICAVMMVRMMGRTGGMCGWGYSHIARDATNDAEGRPRSNDRREAREILEERFARGEISEDEFEGLKQVLARKTP